MSNDFDASPIRANHLYDGLEEEPSYVGEKVEIPGPAGKLEGLTCHPSHYVDGGPIAVICHPHPLYGGSMSNKVVHMLSNALTELGVPTLRFNFRGVGASQGRFDKGVGEVEDLRAAADWFQQRYGSDTPFWLAGFSFGAFVAYRAIGRIKVDRLLLVAPPVAMFEFNDSDGPTMPWMVVQGGRDEITPPQQVSQWVRKQVNEPVYQWLGDADHFFHGRLNELKKVVQESLRPNS